MDLQRLRSKLAGNAIQMPGPLYSGSRRLYHLSLPVLVRLGYDAKSISESRFWQERYEADGGQLRNDHYRAIYTDDFGVPYEYFDEKRILDIGCGPRGSLEWADNAKRRVGLDPLVERYRSLGIDSHKMEYVQAGVEDAPLPDASFDVVTSLNSLDHVDDLDCAIAEISRLVAPGGEVFILTHVHDQPTVVEPVTIPWDLASGFGEEFQVVDELHLELSPRTEAVQAALHDRIPFDHFDQSKRYGALFLRLRRSE